MHPFQCPQCNSKNVRSSLAQNFWESLRKAFGVFPLRCKDCDARWTQPLWDFLNIIYARCPSCYGLELSMWQPQYYHAPPIWKFLMNIGAKPRRCDYCRRNFVSFRTCKIKYQRRKNKAVSAAEQRITLERG